MYSALLPANSGDDAALSFFVAQYKRCREQHILCQISAPHTSFLPTRVIDVGVDGETSVRLCEGDSLILGAPLSEFNACF